MNPLLLYRIAAGLLAFFAIGHTVGLLPPKNLVPEAKAARDSMVGVHSKSWEPTARGVVSIWDLACLSRSICCLL
jgi:hypothetical protein